MNFIRIITADWKVSIIFPETPAWIINFINSKKYYMDKALDRIRSKVCFMYEILNGL